jgi:SAM-dependent methyltransferase
VSPALASLQDAYGQLLLAHHEGRESAEIMERDDGLIYTGDPSAYFASFRRWPAAERRAMRHVRGRVLDVGCGAGRVALHLQERGHEVVAIDESPLAVRVARERGVKDAHALSLADIDSALGLFETILIPRNNLGLAGSDTSARRLLRQLTKLVTERGRIITDSVDPLRLEPEMKPTGPAHRYRVRWLHYATPWFRYLMLTPIELEALIAGTGWRIRTLIDDGSPRYAIVLERS